MAIQIPDAELDKLKNAAICTAVHSKCKKRKVGAAVLTTRNTLYTGVNFNLRGTTCEDEHGHTLASVVHAEVAALNRAKASGERPIAIAVTHPPCENCKQAIVSAGIDPANIYIAEQFLKFDQAKPRYELIPPEAMLAMAEVLTYGAKKYKPNNWRQVNDPNRYVGAALRHLYAYLGGETHDPESKLHHLDMFLTNAAFLASLKDKIDI